jgi:hypothetical protein
VLPSRFRPLLVAAVAFAVLGTAGCEVTTTPEPQTNSADAASAKVRLDELVVAAPHAMTGYSRDRFPHWIAQGGGCDTRDVVLKRDGTNVVATSDCKITSGGWISLYDQKTFSDPKLLDVDHMVPLADAWRTGADTWDDAKRSLFANDLVRPQLLAVSASSNRAKGDQDPSTWRPPNKAYWCQYAQRWVAVKRYWQLTVTDKEKSKLVEMLETCTWPSGAAPTSPTTPAA